ncbi:MAG TPA: succinate dehydrogenase [Thermoanaerobaculia bacterium]|jgi:succinate dehydrogenase / fumarate reductase cytochrome b subunit
MDRSWFRRLHSIAGVVPLGAFLAFHLFVNASARGGPEAYNATVHRLQQLPLLGIVEFVCLLAPLAFHAVGGLFLIATVPPGSEPATRTRSGRARALLQRVTGVLLFAFILFHLWTARLVQIEDHESLDLFHLMQSALANPWIRFVYFGGILAATGHLAAGLCSFAQTWGLARSSRARTAVAVFAVAVFLALAAVGIGAVASFRPPNPV